MTPAEPNWDRGVGFPTPELSVQPPEIKPYRAGSDDDFDRLYRDQYPTLVRSLCLILGDSASAEDCVQEAFVKAYAAWPGWRADAPPGAWVHRIAVNIAYSAIRRRKLQAWTAALLLRSTDRSGGVDPGDVAARSDIVQILSELPARQRMAVVLRYFSGYSNRDLARILRVTEKTVGRDLSQALERLRSRLGTAWRPSNESPISRSLWGNAARELDSRCARSVACAEDQREGTRGTRTRTAEAGGGDGVPGSQGSVGFPTQTPSLSSVIEVNHL